MAVNAQVHFTFVLQSLTFFTNTQTNSANVSYDQGSSAPSLLHASRCRVSSKVSLWCSLPASFPLLLYLQTIIASLLPPETLENDLLTVQEIAARDTIRIVIETDSKQASPVIAGPCNDDNCAYMCYIRGGFIGGVCTGLGTCECTAPKNPGEQSKLYSKSAGASRKQSKPFSSRQFKACNLPPFASFFKTPIQAFKWA